MSPYRHLTNTTDLSRDWVEDDLFPRCEGLRAAERVPQILDGKASYCLFYEPSFLTRTSFERAVGLLGGQAYHTEDASQFFPVHSARFADDITRILASLKIDVAIVRSSDPNVTQRAASVDALPVINGGSSDDHPTQALADLYTIPARARRDRRRYGGYRGQTRTSQRQRASARTCDVRRYYRAADSVQRPNSAGRGRVLRGQRRPLRDSRGR